MNKSASFAQDCARSIVEASNGGVTAIVIVVGDGEDPNGRFAFGCDAGCALGAHASDKLELVKFIADHIKRSIRLAYADATLCFDVNSLNITDTKQ